MQKKYSWQQQMLAWMYGNWISHTFLWECKWSCLCGKQWSDSLSKINKLLLHNPEILDTYLTEVKMYVYTNSYTSTPAALIIQPNVPRTTKFFRKTTDTAMESGILYNHKKEWTSDSCIKLRIPGWKKSIPKITYRAIPTIIQSWNEIYMETENRWVISRDLGGLGKIKRIGQLWL